MRSLALFCELSMLLPIAVMQPFVGVLLWCWVSFMNPHRLVYGGIALQVPWAMSIFVATMIGCVMTREPKRFPVNAVTMLIILFLMLISVSSCFAMAPWQDVYQKWNMTFKSFLFLLVTVSLLTTRERIHALVWVMVVSLAYFGIKGGAFTIIGGGANKVFGPSSSMIGDNNHLATALLVGLPLMNYLRMESKHRIIRAGFALSMVLSLFSVVGSYSRGAFLAMGAMSFFLWLKTSNKLVSGIVIVALVAAAVAFMPEGWVERMQSIGSYQYDGSATGRLNIWHASWVMAKSRPFGSGFYGPYTQSVVDHFVANVEARAVHSIWFEVMGEHGFITFAVWVAIIVSGMVYARRTVRLAKDVPELQWCVNLAKMAQVSTAAYCIGGSFLSLCYWDYYFTILVVISAAYTYVKSCSRIAEGTAARFGQTAVTATVGRA